MADELEPNAVRNYVIPLTPAQLQAVIIAAEVSLEGVYAGVEFEFTATEAEDGVKVMQAVLDAQ